MAYIYLITNKLTNKQYVGQCVCPVSDRFMAHYHDSNRTIPLHSDMHKFGIDNFCIEQIDDVADDIKLDVETYYIDKLNTLIPNGYNVWRHSSNGFSGHSHTRQTREQIGRRVKNWWESASEETLQNRSDKIRQKALGRQFTEEHKRKLSEIARKRLGSKNPFYGKHHNVQSLREMGEKKRLYNFLMLADDGHILHQYESIKEAAEHIKEVCNLQSKQSSIEFRIRECCYGRSQTAYGFGWKQILKSSSECNDYSSGDEISQ